MEKIKNNINEGPNRTEVHNERVNRFIDILTSDEFWKNFETPEKARQAIRQEIKNINKESETNPEIKSEEKPGDIINEVAA